MSKPTRIRLHNIFLLLDCAKTPVSFALHFVCRISEKFMFYVQSKNHITALILNTFSALKCNSGASFSPSLYIQKLYLHIFFINFTILSCFFKAWVSVVNGNFNAVINRYLVNQAA
jgi:hypothetical protein